METEDKFKNSPIHDKRAILELLDKLEPKEIVKVVDFIQEQVKLFCQPDVISSLPSECQNGWENSDYCMERDKCKKCL